MLIELFSHGKSGVGVVDHRMFIDPQHLALSAVSAFARIFGANRFDAEDLYKYIIEHVAPHLSLEHSKAFIAEVTILCRGNSRKPFELLDKYFPEPSAFTDFVRSVCHFLDNSSTAPNDLREAMIAHLEEDDTSWSSSTFELATVLGNLGRPPERNDDIPLSTDQRIRVERIMTRYMEALNTMHTDIQMHAARKNLLNLSGPMRLSAFAELATHDKLKIAGILFDPSGPYSQLGYAYLLVEIQSWMPAIRNVLGDRSIPIEQRKHLVNGLLTELARFVPDDERERPVVDELIGWRDDLARSAEYQGN
jgi:hypothetical protein